MGPISAKSLTCSANSIPEPYPNPLQIFFTDKSCLHVLCANQTAQSADSPQSKKLHE